MTIKQPAVLTGVLLAATGGAFGALARWGLTALGSVIWTTLLINLVGSIVLAALPHIGFVRRSRLLPTFLGTGVLGGFTTMSGAALIHPEHEIASLLAFFLTAALTLPLVRLVGRIVAPAEATAFEEEGGDE